MAMTNLTLTSVVFEYVSEGANVYWLCNLALTSVVFE